MSPQALRRRMAHGNIYTADKIDAALSRYFREGNLTALRELALLWLADRVDEGLERYRDQHEIDSTWATRERIVVPVSGGPESSTLMRRAARIATRRSGGEWQALYVTRQDGLTGTSPDRLTGSRPRPRSSAARFHTVVGDDPADAILSFARAENATQVVIGASRRGRVSTLLRPGVGERVVTGSGDIDVHIVTHDYARSAVGRGRRSTTSARRRRLAGLVFGLVVPAVLSGLLYLTADFHGLPDRGDVADGRRRGDRPHRRPLAGGRVGAGERAAAQLPLHPAALHADRSPSRRTSSPSRSSSRSASRWRPSSTLAARRTAAGARGAGRGRRAHRARAQPADLERRRRRACCRRRAGSSAPTARPSCAADDAGEDEVVASCGTPPLSVERADMSAAIDEQSTLVLAGATLPASERGLLNAYAAYAKVMAERRLATAAEVERLAAEGGRPHPYGPARRRVARPPQPARRGQGGRRQPAQHRRHLLAARTRTTCSRRSRSPPTGSSRSWPTCST